MRDQQQLNKTKYKDVAAADVKASKGYEDISDELAQRIADAIRIYTEIIYHCFQAGRFEQQRASVISMNKAENKKAA